MPKRPHTELQCSPDGPWVTIHAGDRHLTFSLREFIRDLMPAERYSDRRHIMADWVKARDAEGKPEPAKAPPLKNERKRTAKR